MPKHGFNSSYSINKKKENFNPFFEILGEYINIYFYAKFMTKTFQIDLSFAKVISDSLLKIAQKSGNWLR